MNHFFELLEFLDYILWSYISLAMILSMGLYLTIKSRFYQLKVLFKIRYHFKSLMKEAGSDKAGVHPLKLYFASLGGMVGIGNMVAVVSTVTVGGPGSIVWLWMASFLGMIVKYSEIYLGITYRIPNLNNGYDGGPMYYLQVAFGSKIMPMLFCILICIYGAEVSQFLIITDTFASLFAVDKIIVIIALLSLVLLSAVGGVKRLANICSFLMPPLLVVYISLGLYILGVNYTKLPAVFHDIFSSVFTGHAAVGGFVGSTVMLAAHYGVSRSVYSGDIGIGYDATVLSESQTKHPEKQARMAIFALFADITLCTISVLIILTTGVWQIAGLQLSEYVMFGLATVISHADIFVSIVFFISGFTTIVGFLVVGRKCAYFLNPKYGILIYMIYAIASFIFFSFHDQSLVMLIMSVSGGMLLIINLAGLFKLRHQIKFP